MSQLAAAGSSGSRVIIYFGTLDSCTAQQSVLSCGCHPACSHIGCGDKVVVQGFVSGATGRPSRHKAHSKHTFTWCTTLQRLASAHQVLDTHLLGGFQWGGDEASIVLGKQVPHSSCAIAASSHWSICCRNDTSCYLIVASS